MRTVHPLAHLADEDLMAVDEAIASRAFEVVYDRHGRPAYSLAYRILGSRGPAEDAVQEAFLTVWRSRARYLPERGSVRAWLLAIVHARSIDVLRRNAVHLKRQASVEDFEDIREAKERTDVEVIRREEAGEVATPWPSCLLPSRRSSSSPTSAVSPSGRSPRCSPSRSGRSREGCAWASRSCAADSPGRPRDGERA
jgi:RNA polymerase sigma factor (sigma-70 family)